MEHRQNGGGSGYVPTVLRGWCIVLLVVGALAACGEDVDGSGEDAAPATSTSTTTTATSSSTSTTASATSTSTSTTLGRVVTLPGDTAEEAMFTTPTGNISCAVHVETGGYCSIGEIDWAPPPKPADCEFDWGSDLQLGDEASFACVSDARIHREPAVLPYGSAVQRGRYSCGVEETGVTCLNADTGAGFRLARGRYELFGG